MKLRCSSKRKLRKHQKGEMPVGTILVIALIVIPLVFLLIAARDKIVPMFTEDVQEVTEDDGNQRPTIP